jgi:hypothetical protein
MALETNNGCSKSSSAVHSFYLETATKFNQLEAVQLACWRIKLRQYNWHAHHAIQHWLVRTRPPAPAPAAAPPMVLNNKLTGAFAT